MDVSQVAGARVSVLVVEPDDGRRDAAVETLRPAANSVVGVATWDECLATLAARDIGLVLVDEHVFAARMSCFDDARRIRPFVRVVAVSGAGLLEDVTSALVEASLLRRGLAHVAHCARVLHAAGDLRELLEAGLHGAVELHRLAGSPRGQAGPPQTRAEPSAFIASVVPGAGLALRAGIGRFGASSCVPAEELAIAADVVRTGELVHTERASIWPVGLDHDATTVIWSECPSGAIDPLLVDAFTRQLAAAIANHELRQLASTDPLTGTHSRRSLDAAMVREIRAAHRFRLALSILLVDMDELKLINDSGGHVRGDQAIAMVAERLRRCTRSVDIIGRFGGDEFVVVLPGTNSAGARVVADRIISAMTDASVSVGDRAIAVRVSIGSAALAPPREHGPPFTTDGHCRELALQLLELADIGLYDVKHRGRSSHSGPIEIDWDGSVVA